MPLEIPIELAPVFEAYRGTGKFTVGAVMEYVHRYGTVKSAMGMNALQWAEHAVSLSESKGLLDGVDRDQYINDNIEYWLDVWKDARNGYVLFRHEHAKAFEDEGLLSVYLENAASCGGYTPAVFDLVRINGAGITNGIQLQQEQEGQCPVLPGHGRDIQEEQGDVCDG